MVNFERSHSSGIDQAHINDDRKQIETHTHHESQTTTWDDLTRLRDRLKQLVDDLPVDNATPEKNTKKSPTREEIVANAREQVLNSYHAPQSEDTDQGFDRSAALESINNLRMSDDELIELTSEWADVEIDGEALQKSIERNGNPNIHGKGLFFESGNLPMDDDSVYRHVGTSAIADLMVQGYVRNKRETADALDIPGKSGFGTAGPNVYWNDGDSTKREKADMVIQATKAAAEKGYVTKDDIQGIWVTDKNTGEPVNLIDGKDHTGLEMAEHKP